MLYKALLIRFGRLMKKKNMFFLKKFRLRYCTSVLFFLTVIRMAEAGIGPPLRGVTNLSTFISWLIGIIVMILWPAIVVLWCFVGFKFVAAQGNAEQLIEARRALVYALVGTAIVAGAQVLKAVIEGTIGSLS